ncbi:MAG: EAL and HDOD domain-containing protein [Solirubrobacteraceae bacterium]
MAEVYVARQPIFNRKQSVIGYELLFRDGQANTPAVSDHQAATASVVLNSLTEIGLKRIVGARGAWIKMPRESISQGLVELLPQRAVVEIPKRETIDDELIETVADLQRTGKRVALDHFSYTPDAEPLLRLVDYVKLDLVDLGREQFSSEVAQLKRYSVKLLAARVENHKDHAFCRQSGCELFQGYFFCRPEVMHGRRIDANRPVLLDLLATLQDPGVELDELQGKIALDVGLSVRLLRYINSAFFGLRQPVRSIGQALALLGVEHVRRWAALTLFASVDDKPQELKLTALVRARFCELAAEQGFPGEANELFTCGLFSVIDALLDEPIEEALAGVPLAQDIRDALVRHAGPMGQLLDCLTALETGAFDRAEAILSTAGPLYMSALTWADTASEPLFDR